MNKKGKKAVIKRFAAMLATVCFAAMLCVFAGCTVMPAPNENQVALVGKTYYEDLGEAISAAKNGETVTLFKDVDLSDTLVIENKKLLLDLNGKTIYNTKDIWCAKNENSWSLISVRGTADVTIIGNGKMLAKENDIYAVDVFDKTAKLTVESGELVGNIHAVYVVEGEAVIKGGTYSVQQIYSETLPYEFTLNLYDASRKEGVAKMTVYGGTFYKFNPGDNHAEGAGTNFLASGYESVLSGDYYTVVKSAE